jgi:SPP1 gp7 family putative phage head morphogenesis protein
MTPAALKAIDDERRKREDELVLLLLLMLAWSVERSDDVTEVARVLRRYGVDEIARTMADAHLDGFAFYATGDGPTVDQLVRQYQPQATEMAEAMIDTIESTEGEALSLILLAAHYSRSDSEGLRLGAERQVATAHNAGLLSGAIAASGGESGPTGRVSALRHVSVIDDRTTDICNERDGLTLSPTDPYWLANWPSLHWNCRSIIEPVFGRVPLSETLPTVPPSEGFGAAPPGVAAMVRRRISDGRIEGPRREPEAVLDL